MSAARHWHVPQALQAAPLRLRQSFTAAKDASASWRHAIENNPEMRHTATASLGTLNEILTVSLPSVLHSSEPRTKTSRKRVCEIAQHRVEKNLERNWYRDFIPDHPGQPSAGRGVWQH